MSQNEKRVSLVGKVGSMALIRREDNDIDYNILSRLGDELRPGMIWVTSGAAEIGRLDYMKRNGGHELTGDAEECKTITVRRDRRYLWPIIASSYILNTRCANCW